MSNSLQIQETAFVTATYRASDELLSKDVYSKLWKNDKTDKWIANYVKAVSEHEPFVHCLRNRYFFETINKLFLDNEIEVLINFGSGFSMYPFLLDDKLINIEIDQLANINHKKAKIANFIKEGKLPVRDVKYLIADFKSDLNELVSELKEITQGKKSFIVLEGVLFFLNRADTNNLFDVFRQLQPNGGYVGSVSFIDAIENTDSFKRMVAFFQKQVGANNHFNYQTIQTDYYDSMTYYNLIEHEDYLSLSKQYAPERQLKHTDNILNEHMYVLKKKL